jgi:hypothetical protein
MDNKTGLIDSDNDIEYDELDELDEFSDETDAERDARESTEVHLDENDAQFVERIIDKMLLFTDELSGHPLYGYQRPFARRVFQSMIINDGATITALFSRQSGKSETIANCIATIMILFPIFSKMWPKWFGDYKEGVWVGAFAPVDDQADTLFSRIVDRLTSETALALMADPEIDDGIVGNRGVKGKGKEVKLKNSGSLVRKQTCHPRATIEGRTYHIIVVDESQGADEKMVNKSIGPMGASTNATMVFTGTPSYEKGVFYKTIQMNKRAAVGKGRQNHFEADWKECSKWNSNYKKFVQKEMRRIGEDADEFKLSYRLMWLLDQGMFTTSERLEELGDKSMEIVRAYKGSPVVVGIDPARKQDSTIVTVMWVGWDYPDEMGYYDHRILAWLDLSGLPWEVQYFRIVEFLSNYNVFKIAIDAGGLGDVVGERLQILMPNTEIEMVTSSRQEQSKRWKHLGQLLERGRISWPAHAKTRRLKTYRRFILQMGDLLKKFEGPYVLAEAPKEAGAHDDYPDSTALAAVLTKDYTQPTIEVYDSSFLYQ